MSRTPAGRATHYPAGGTSCRARRFRRHNETDCFIALCEELGNELLAQLASFNAQAEEPGNALEALNRGIRAYLQWWPDRPALARAYFVELPQAGPRAIEER